MFSGLIGFYNRYSWFFRGIYKLFSTVFNILWKTLWIIYKIFIFIYHTVLKLIDFLDWIPCEISQTTDVKKPMPTAVSARNAPRVFETSDRRSGSVFWTVSPCGKSANRHYPNLWKRLVSKQADRSFPQCTPKLDTLNFPQKIDFFAFLRIFSKSGTYFRPFWSFLRLHFSKTLCVSVVFSTDPNGKVQRFGMSKNVIFGKFFRFFPLKTDFFRKKR